MSDFIVRQYIASDKEAVKELYRFASVHSEIGYREGPWEKDFEDIENAYLKDGDFLVGVLGTQIVAIGAYEKISDDVGHIRRMRTHPYQRRKGFAQQIIQGLERSAKTNGLTELRLRTSTQQEMAQSFYEKNGYKKLIAEKTFYTEGSFEVVWYGKQLD